MGTESMPGTRGIEAGIDRTPGVTKSGTYLELVHSWIITVDHKRLGILYICYALVFLLVAGVEALLIRAQLFYPHNDFISPFTFNRLFTMHGTTM
ncbi:MAG: cbb3-type cytochrome c oxidase subunit I, partial [Terracidiphilus sp.]